MKVKFNVSKGNKRKRLNKSSTSLWAQNSVKKQSKGMNIENKQVFAIKTEEEGMFQKHFVGSNSTSSFSADNVPLLLKSRIRMDKMGKNVNEDDNFKADLNSRPVEKPLTSQTYEDFPVEGFGARILSSLGWKPEPSQPGNVKSSHLSALENIVSSESAGVDRNSQNKNDNDPFTLKVRPPRLGLGSLVQQKDVEKSQNLISLEKKLKFKIATITKGKFIGKIGVILSLRETEQFVFVSLALNVKTENGAKLPIFETIIKNLKIIKDKDELKQFKDLKARVLKEYF